MASRLPDLRAPLASRVVANEPMHLYVGYARHCGMAARQLAQLLPTLVSFVAGCIVMIWLDSTTTAALALLAVLALVAQYPANHKAAQASRDWERSRAEALRRMVELFSALRRAPTPLDDDGPVLNSLYAEPSMRDYTDGFSDRSHAAEQAALVSRIGSSLVLCGAMLLLGMDIVHGEKSWAAVAAYVAAVRFTLTDFVQVSTLANGFTRFHAQLTLYRQFVGDAAKVTAPLPRTSDRPPALHIRDLLTGARIWQPQPGAIAAMLVPPTPVGSVPMMLMEAADKAEGPVLVARIDRALLDDTAPLRALLGLTPDTLETEIAAAVAKFDPAGASATAAPPFEPGWLDMPARQGWRRDLSLGRVTALQAVAATRRGAALVSMDLMLFNELGSGWRAAAAGELAKAVLLLVYQPTDVTSNLDLHLARLGRLGESAAIVADGKRLTGWVPLDGAGQPPPALGVAYRAVLSASAPAQATADQDQEETPAVDG